MKDLPLYGPHCELIAWRSQEGGLSEVMMNTDFSPVERLLLIYPEDVWEPDCNYSELSPFYDELIRLIPEEVHVTVLWQSKSIGSRVRNLRKKLDY